MNSPSRSVRWISRAIVVLLIAACRSDSTDITQPPQEGPPLTSGTVSVNRTAVFLTATGQTRQLTVQTRDGSGSAVNAAVLWSSSAPDQVSVDATGRVTARTIGSAMVFATSGGVKSAPVFVVVAEPLPGALLVDDSQVLSVGQPLGLAVGDAPTVGTRYDVRLTGITTPPSPGTIVLAAESSPVSGKVVAVRNEAGAMVVTLAMAPLRELLARYDINWSIDLDELSGAGGSTGSNIAVANVSVPSQPHANLLDPVTAFDCDASLGPVLLDRKVQLAPTMDLKLDIIDNPGHVRRAIVGTQKLVGSISLKLNAGFQFKGKCEAQVPIVIPIGGPLAVGVAPGVRIGVGASLDGQIALTAGELSVTGELGAQLEVGWECGGATATCQSLQTLTPINTIKPKYEVFNPQTGMRVKLEGQFYVFAALDAVFATVFHVGILEAKAGPVQSVDLGFEEDQALNPGYASKYDLKLEAVVQPGSGLQAVLDNILSGISLTFRTKFSKDISESPSGVLTVSHPIVPPSGQSVDIKVDLRNTDYFLIGYNVVRVELWRKKPDSSSFSRMRAFDVTASNQSIFTYTWQPTVDDLGTTEFAAFVYTEFPVPGLEVAPNSIAKVLVSCFSAAPRGVARVVGAANTCADEWQGTATFFQPGMIQIEVVATWRRDPASTDPGRVDYIATGVATVKWLDYENKGCSVTPTVFPFTSSGGLTVEYSDDPPSYGFLAAIPLPVTVTCDGMSLDVPHSGLWLVGSGRVSANGTQIRGRNDAGDGIFWDWSFGRP